MPEQTTSFDAEIGRISVDTGSLSLPVLVTITEHDAIFNDVGSNKQTIELELENEKTRHDTIIVYVTERRWFFWKARAKFSMIIETIIESISPQKRIPTVSNPLWTGDFNDDPEAILLARVIFGEARSEVLSNDVRTAVGWSVRNRVEYKNALRYGGTYHAVILKPKQYSSFNVDDPNRYFIENPLADENSIDTSAWKNCYKIAEDILDSRTPDLTSGANHYFDDSITSPKWAKSKYFKVKIGPLSFYDIP